MDGIEHRERADAWLRRIVAPTGQHSTDRIVNRRSRRNMAAQARGHLCEMHFSRREQVGPHLKVTRIFARLAIHDARMRRTDEVTRGLVFGYIANERLHRFGELIEPDGFFHKFTRVGLRERFVVGKEIIRANKIFLREFVVAAMDGVVRLRNLPANIY